MPNMEAVFNGRFKQYGSYRFDKLIFNVYFLAVFFSLFGVAYYYKFDLDFYSCDVPAETLCKNPFYKPLTWRNAEYLPAGEYGTKPGFMFNMVYILPIAFFIVSMLINHAAHNRGVIDWEQLKRGEQLVNTDTEGLKPCRK